MNDINVMVIILLYCSFPEVLRSRLKKLVNILQGVFCTNNFWLFFLFLFSPLAGHFHYYMIECFRFSIVFPNGLWRESIISMYSTYYF